MHTATALVLALLAQDKAEWKLRADQTLEFSWSYSDKSETSSKAGKVARSDVRSVDGKLRAPKAVAGDGQLDVKIARASWSLDTGDFELSIKPSKSEIVRHNGGDSEKAAKARLKAIQDYLSLDYALRASGEHDTQFGFRAAKGLSSGRNVSCLFTGAYVCGAFPDTVRQGAEWFESVFGAPGVIDAGVESEMLRMKVASAGAERFTVSGELKKKYDRMITSCVAIHGTISIRREYTFERSGMLSSSREEVRFVRKCADEVLTQTLIQELTIK